MRTSLIVASLAAALVTALPPDSARALQTERSATPRESRIPVGNASLYSREIGRGQPIIVLHGGPDFDHGYLLPDLDRLADAFRLVYYDQRGRGKSADRVQREDVTIMSDVEDLDKVRGHFQLESPALLGHSNNVAILAADAGNVISCHSARRNAARSALFTSMATSPPWPCESWGLRIVGVARDLGAPVDEGTAGIVLPCPDVKRVEGREAEPVGAVDQMK
jgi:pimeloyl-ACP methyl ester carboxylesterase